MTDLSGKKAMVLGGSRGIGAAIVRSFVALGADTVFTFATAAAEADALQSQSGASAVRVDSANRDELVTAVESQAPLDILVVSAGVFLFGDPTTLEISALERMFAVNIEAPYFASVAAARSMRDNGRIIFIGSNNADHIPLAGASAYAMTKAALQGLARGLARDLGARGITVNVLQPGPTNTALNPEDGPFADFARGQMAIKRYVQPSEIASFVAYIASAEAAMVTGAVHTIDGGFNA